MMQGRASPVQRTSVIACAGADLRPCRSPGLGISVRTSKPLRVGAGWHQEEAMSKTIVLAVDTARPEAGEHAVGRFGRIQVDCAEGDRGHVARRILAVAQSVGAR